MSKRPERYVVGFIILRGKGGSENRERSIVPMRISDARKLQKEINEITDDKIIYELVPVGKKGKKKMGDDMKDHSPYHVLANTVKQQAQRIRDLEWEVLMLRKKFCKALLFVPPYMLDAINSDPPFAEKGGAQPKNNDNL